MESMKNDPSSSSFRSLESSTKFEILLVAGCVRYFKWEIMNFSHTNTNFLFFSDYFDLGNHRFRFILYPSVDKSSRRKHLCLQLEASDAGSSRSSCFIRSKISVVNHVYAADSIRKYIFHRFAFHSHSYKYCDHKFAELDYLRGREHGFLLNGSDLHIRGDVISLMELQSLVPVGIVSEHHQFGWTIQNYSFFEEILRVGTIKSDTFWIGECSYCMILAIRKYRYQEYLSMFLEPLVSDRADRNAWIVSDVTVKSPNLRREKITRNTSGRTGRWITLMNMSEFESSINQLQGFTYASNILALTLEFTALEERDFLRHNMANSKTIWNFGEVFKATISAEKKVADKAFEHYSWDILNFFRIEKLEEIRSRRIRVREFEMIMVIYPGGESDSKRHLGIFLTPDDHLNDGLDMLVHYRLAALNQKDPELTIKMERIERFERATTERLYGFPEFIPTSIVNKYSAAGYIVQGRTTFDAYIHVLEEKYTLQVKCLRWKVDNFLAWEGIRGSKPVLSRFFLVHDCLLRIEISVSEDGIVYSTLIGKTGHIYRLRFRIRVINQLDLTDESKGWEILAFRTDEKKLCRMGTLSDILKEGAGYVVDDKIVFYCQVIACNRVRI